MVCAKRLGVVVAVALLVVAGLAGCSDEQGDAAPTADSQSQAGPADPATLPQVGLIDEAVTALEAELGLPAEFFEINATSTVVNMFVAVNERTKVQPWAYASGELESREVLDAQGNVFVKEVLDFDETRVLSTISSDLPGSVLSVFVVEGNAAGQVQYSVVIDSGEGFGQLVAVLAPDGRVLSVDPV